MEKISDAASAAGLRRGRLDRLLGEELCGCPLRVFFSMTKNKAHNFAEKKRMGRNSYHALIIGKNEIHAGQKPLEFQYSKEIVT